jgi:hypothetical protein
MAQVVQCLPSKRKGPGSNSSHNQKKKRKVSNKCSFMLKTKTRQKNPKLPAQFSFQSSLGATSPTQAPVQAPRFENLFYKAATQYRSADYSIPDCSHLSWTRLGLQPAVPGGLSQACSILLPSPGLVFSYHASRLFRQRNREGRGSLAPVWGQAWIWISFPTYSIVLPHTQL